MAKVSGASAPCTRETLVACRPADHLAWNRRTLLTASSLGFCGLALPQVGAARTRQRAKSVILIWLTGGPSHVDLWDMKPQAPSDYRGEFQSIATSAPEIRLGELLPHVAQQAHLAGERITRRRLVFPHFRDHSRPSVAVMLQQIDNPVNHA